jgi:hypothetical protein
VDLICADSNQIFLDVARMQSRLGLRSDSRVEPTWMGCFHRVLNETVRVALIADSGSIVSCGKGSQSHTEATPRRRIHMLFVVSSLSERRTLV